MPPINYRIQAEVIDIRRDTPRRTDQFLVDTCVWLWMTYSRTSLGPEPPFKYKIQAYPAYISKAKGVGAALFRCGLTLPELAHQIEENERKIFQSTRPPPAELKPKEYRHNYPSERADVVEEIQSAWAQVKSLADPLDLTVDDVMTDAALTRIGSDMLDGYDLFMVEQMLASGMVKVITDDGDYASVAGLRVFTANQNVINAARSQGKLIVR